ncbi:cobyric acid synthase [Paenibacillus sp. 1001270B_150601_E10]|uniref:cobyric acid synthase n=1 Tax=Paenibacillus sp. 1001270B_150601_E10 TaxID=2787079 RepID=UPI00189FD856|nr:cobyric acid synthase [Paenibacillus sp. 1001270B_150601_E10]
MTHEHPVSKPVQGRAIMLQGTASDVGKSVVTTALCRIFKQDGYKVAPFKSQNMALNSYVTPDGKEIGRAQGVQAEACGILATTDMNPVLIKPMQDMQSQVVVHGKPYLNMSARNYRSDFLPVAKDIVTSAMNRLKEEYDIVVMEGAGSPAEINLKQNDIVNMNMAKWADAPVILVADIDRGGVFASIVGTLELLEPDERDRVVGFIINKFRGDVELLRPGLTWLEERTGKPVLGVLPYANDLDIEAEDSVQLEQWKGRVDPENDLDIAVMALPRISNFTDIDPLHAEADVRVRYVRRVEELGSPDIILIPGTKSTIADLEWLRATGLAQGIEDIRKLRQLEGKETHVVGICGGYQMLGLKLEDPYGAEAEPGTEVLGLGLLPVRTSFLLEKRTEQVKGKIAAKHGKWQSLHKEELTGYEIHMGTSTHDSAGHHELLPFSQLCSTGSHEVEEEPILLEGAVSEDGLVFGTYLHGVFHHDSFRRHWLNMVRSSKGLPALPITLHYQEKREQAYDRLADLTRKHLNMELIHSYLKNEANDKE